MVRSSSPLCQGSRYHSSVIPECIIPHGAHHRAIPGAAPAYYTSTAATSTFGPYTLPPVTLEGVAIDVTPGFPLRLLPVTHFEVR